MPVSSTGTASAGNERHRATRILAAAAPREPGPPPGWSSARLRARARREGGFVEPARGQSQHGERIGHGIERAEHDQEHGESAGPRGRRRRRSRRRPFRRTRAPYAPSSPRARRAGTCETIARSGPAADAPRSRTTPPRSAGAGTKGSSSRGDQAGARGHRIHAAGCMPTLPAVDAATATPRRGGARPRRRRTPGARSGGRSVGRSRRDGVASTGLGSGEGSLDAGVDEDGIRLAGASALRSVARPPPPASAAPPSSTGTVPHRPRRPRRRWPSPLPPPFPAEGSPPPLPPPGSGSARAAARADA